MTEAKSTPSKPLLDLTRRDFLWWTAGAAAGSQLGFWRPALADTRVGLIGLGQRGGALLGVLAGTAHAKIDALCDLDPDRLRRAAASLRSRPMLESSDAGALCRARDLDVIVLAAPQSIQVELAALACACGKDVFLARPLPSDPSALRALATLAAERDRLVQVSRTKRLTLQPGRPATLVSSDPSSIAGIELRCTRRGAPSSVWDFGLIDELDFVLESAPGTVVRLTDLGSSGSGPFRWPERRRQYEIVGDAGTRRRFSLVERWSATGPPETSTLRLSSHVGEVRIHSAPTLDVGEPDLATILTSRRRGSQALGLSVGRVVEISDHFGLELGG